MMRQPLKEDIEKERREPDRQKPKKEPFGEMSGEECRNQ
jgi:hypothetical protein